MSSSEELVQEPMHTWSTFMGPISLTDFTASESGGRRLRGQEKKVDVDDLGIFGVIVGKNGQ